jgi:hypothetical protein
MTMIICLSAIVVFFLIVGKVIKNVLERNKYKKLF